MSSIDELLVRAIDPGRLLTLFRIVRAPELDSPELVASFASSFALDRPPRGVEQRLVILQMGISMFERASQAAGVARRFPAIGGWLARVQLREGAGTCVARTGPPGHLTVWGRPLQLVEAVVDIRPVHP